MLNIVPALAPRFTRHSSRLKTVALVATLTMLGAGAAQAQGSMGGMGGSGGRGMGGMGGRPQLSSPDPSRATPSDAIRERMESADIVRFLLDKKKPLQLTKPQQDSLKTYQKESERMQSPLFAAIDKEYADRPPLRGVEASGTGTDAANNGTRSASADATAPTLKRLKEIQDAYGDRARALLSDGQRVQADSLYTRHLNELREKEAKRRGQRPFPTSPVPPPSNP